VITRLVELGTPNMGTPCATVGSAVAGTLLTPGTLLGLTTIIQLTPQYLSGFNRAMPGFNGTKVSVEAGDIGTRKLCNPSSENDDEIVPVSSAWWTIPDHGVMAGLKHTEMTGSRTAWTAWVGPHLAVDTDGHPQFGQTAAFAAPSAAARRLAAATPPSRLAAATAVTLGAKRSTTVRVKVPRGDTALAIQLVAGSAVNASLINPAGHVVATQRGPSAEGSLGLRGLQVSKPTAGSWTLRLTNTGSRALPTVAEAWLVRDALTASAHAAQKAKRGPLTVTVQLRRSGRAYLGQPVTAKLRFESGGRATSVWLHDDGRGGDARARDGIYSARVSRPASGLVDLVTTATTKAGNAYSVLRYTAS
jgi:hypothetical protein